MARNMIPISMLLLALLGACTTSKPKPETPGATVAADMEVVWQKTYGGTQPDVATHVLACRDGGFLLSGASASYGKGDWDMWILKLDSAGKKEWAVVEGGEAQDKAYCALQRGDGGFLVAGWTKSEGKGGFDIMLLSLSPSGKIIWKKTYGNPGDDKVYTLLPCGDGGCLLVGDTIRVGKMLDAWLLCLDSSGNIQWQKTLGGPRHDRLYSGVRTKGGGYVLAGFTGTGNAAGNDFWLVRLTAAGELLSQHSYGGKGNDYAYSIAAARNGHYLLAGITTSFDAKKNDLLLYKIDAVTRKVVWKTVYGGDQDELDASVLAGGDGGCYLLGSSGSWGAGGFDILLVCIAPDGKPRWRRSFGGKANDGVAGLVSLGGPHYALAGFTASRGKGMNDMWLLRLREKRVPIP